MLFYYVLEHHPHFLMTLNIASTKLIIYHFCYHRKGSLGYRCQANIQKNILRCLLLLHSSYSDCQELINFLYECLKVTEHSVNDKIDDELIHDQDQGSLKSHLHSIDGRL